MYTVRGETLVGGDEKCRSKGTSVGARGPVLEQSPDSGADIRNRH